MNQFYLDLHTHSIVSYDGGIEASQYEKILNKNFVVAVTDHNEVSFAKSLHEKLGSKIIVGEEILTRDGEIIGLFLGKKIEKNLSVEEAIEQIRSQSGLVYIPHPLEKSRRGLSVSVLEKIANSIDIIEVFNGRLREPWLLKKAEMFALKYKIAQVSSSDAHGIRGVGNSFSIVNQLPTRDNLLDLLQNASLVKHRAPFVSFLDPTRNRLLRFARRFAFARSDSDEAI